MAKAVGAFLFCFGCVAAGASMSMIAGRRLALLLAALTPGAAGAAEQVKVGLDLTISGYHAPWMVAQRKGYFTEQGLDVSIGRGFGSGDTVKRVASGEIDVGFHHTANLIIANSEGAQLRVVMSYLVQELCGAFSAAEDGNVTTAKKLEGQTWGGPKTGVCTDILPAVMEAAGVDTSKVKVRIVQQAERFPMLAAGTITATDSYLDKAFFIRKELAAANKTMVYFRFADYVSMYSSSVTVTRETMEKRPEMIEKIIVGLLKGFKFTVAEPDEAARIIGELHPDIDKGYLRESLDLLLYAMWDDTARSKGPGFIDAAKMQGERDVLVRYLKLAASMPIENLYTNRFVEAAHQKLK
jgi:NitT/TauT family transport system substrate-binding protein